MLKSSLEGWPDGVRTFKNSDFKEPLADLSYLERTAVARQLCLAATVFIGNSHSSFTRAIIDANAARPNYVYNCPPTNRTVLVRCADVRKCCSP